MLIEISRFKYYSRSISYEFEENQLNLLTGPSNTGKSTIFLAIYWCLYGSRKSVCPKTIKTTNEKPTTIKLTFDSGIVITRIKPPDLLSVVLEDGTELEEDSAVEWIEQFFGSENTFLATTYMKQKKEHPLLELTNSKKMSLLREITFGKAMIEKSTEDPVFYSEKIAIKIKQTKDEILKITGRISVLDEQYIVSKKENKKNITTWKDMNTELNETTIETLEDNKKTNETNINNLRKKITKARKEWEIYNLNVKRRDQLLDQQNSLTTQLNMCKYSKDILTTQLDNLNLKKQYDKQTNEVMATKPEENICEFLDNQSQHIDAITTFLAEEANFHKLNKNLNVNSSEDIHILIETTTKEIQNIETANLKYEEYKLQLKNYDMLKKQWRQWNTRKQLAEQAKLEYDNFYDNPDLKAIIFLLNSEKDLCIKDVLKTYYTSKQRFGKVIQILQKVIYDFNMSETLLICPKCETCLELTTTNNKSVLIESSINLDKNMMNRNTNRIAEKGITAINKLDFLLTEYQSKKDIGEEPENPTSLPEFTPVNGDITNLKTKLRKLEAIKFPDLHTINTLVGGNYNVEDLHMFINEQSNYDYYKRGLLGLKKLAKFTIPIDNLSIKHTQELLTELTSLDAQNKSISSELTQLNEIIIPTLNIPELESRILHLEVEIKKDTKLIDIGTKLLNLSKLEIELDTNKAKLENLIIKLKNLDTIKQIIVETGSDAMEETVETINNVLQDISSVIFNNDTTILLSMYKEFKTKEYLKLWSTDIKQLRASFTFDKDIDNNYELCVKMSSNN